MQFTPLAYLSFLRYNIKKNTPCPEDIQCNLEMFLQKWEDKLPETTLDAVKKIRNTYARDVV